MDEQRIAEIEARATKATKGPWGAMAASGWPCGTLNVMAGPRNFICWRDDLGDSTDANFMFIAHARTDIPDLIAAWREQQQRIAELEAERDGLRKVLDALVTISSDLHKCVVCGRHENSYSTKHELFCPMGRYKQAAQEQRAEPEGEGA